ncbi:MAG: thiolase family protein [Acidobacteriota bacterium]
MSTPRLFLVAPVRTPIGKFGGALQSLSAADLGTAAAKACLERSGIDPGVVDQVVFGHGRQAGGGPNTARQILYRAGIPVERPAMTLNQACGSGLQAIFTAARAILLGEASVVLAGGTESMSNTPYMLPRARWGYRMGQAEIVDGMYQDGFNDPLSKLVMGETAEELAAEAGIDRAAADAWGLRSQLRCETARKAGRFAAEIAPITIPGKKGDTVLDADEHPRDGMTLEAMQKLPAVFRKNGTVTAGNASGITDGAAAILVASEEAVREHGLHPVARLIGWSVVGCEPRIMGIGPVPACAELEKKTGVRIGDVDRMELNEAFASQVLACLKGLEIDPEKVNPDGGAIALGHPIGCTGTRIMVTLLHGLAASGGKRGVATLCVSGGMGLAALVEMA